MPDCDPNLMTLKRLGFQLVFCIRHYLCGLPGILFSLPVQRGVRPVFSHGIRIVDPYPQADVPFSNFVTLALDLIERSDPIRFGRVRTQIRTIVNITGIIGSVYDPALRSCTIGGRCCTREAKREDTFEILASIFVRDATIGHLLRHGVLRTKRNYDCFDRLCAREAQRFMQRLGIAKTPWDPDQLMRPKSNEAIAATVRGFVAAEKEAAANAQHGSRPSD